MKSGIVRARVDESLKADTEVIFDKLGLSTSEAINLFLAQVKLSRGMPFPLRVPNDVTLKTFADTDAGRNLVRSKDAGDMFKKLGI
jgi:DNA-damage-inducible protein J